MKTRISFAAALTLSCAIALSGCGSKQSAQPDKAVQIKDYTSTIRDGKEVVDPVHGKEISMMYGAITGVNNTNANGVGYIYVYEDGFNAVFVNLNILLAPEGKKYVAHLTDEKNTTTMLLGDLQSIVGDVRHSLRFESNGNLSSYNTFLVSLDDNVIAEGKVKAPSEPID